VFSHRYELETMRYSARAEYEQKYTAEANYLRLMAVYETALSRSPESALRSSEAEAIG
jgi:hypothetical protein